MELDYIEEYLKVDFDDDDKTILLLSEVAENYIKAGVGSCDYSDARVKLLALVIITELYENRSFAVKEEKFGAKARFTIRSIITQLQAEELIKNEGAI